MKNTTILLLAYLALSCSKKTENTDTGQSNMVWVKQNSGTTMDLYSVDFPSRDTGYAAGGTSGNPKGVILKTTDGGSTWTPLDTPDSTILTSVQFLDANTGYAVGNQKICKTTDGGKTWKIQPYQGQYCWLRSVCFTDRNTGHAVGSYGYDWYTSPAIFRTTDGGANWTRQFLGEPRMGDVLNTVFFRDANNGYSAGEGLFIKTTDGGTTWVDHTASFYSGINCENGYFADSTIGYMVNGSILKTTDGGATWTEHYPPAAFRGYYYSVYFTSINRGYTVGGSMVLSNGQFVKYIGIINETSDGGATWKGLVLNNTGNLRSVCFPDVYTGYAVGDSGVILKTTIGRTGAK